MQTKETKPSFRNHPAGEHILGIVMDAKVGDTATEDNFSSVKNFRTLTSARKALVSGQAIVRKSDRRIIAIKW